MHDMPSLGNGRKTDKHAGSAWNSSLHAVNMYERVAVKSALRKYIPYLKAFGTLLVEINEVVTNLWHD